MVNGPEGTVMELHRDDYMHLLVDVLLRSRKCHRMDLKGFGVLRLFSCSFC